MTAVEKRLTALKPIYDPRKALEHMQILPGIMPVRLFALLFPLWDIEITAMQEEGRPYELMEKYVERGIDEGQLRTVEELAAFFGLQREIVIKILGFLETIGHVKQSGMHWELTPLGYRSVREDKKYVEQEKRIRLYFDAYTSLPLRKEHYNGKKVRIFSPEEAAEITHAKSWGYRFHLIISMQAWQPQSLRQLEARVDRESYNVPPEMQRIQAHAVRPAYLPMYIIETTRMSPTSASAQSRSGARPYYLVYTGIRDLRDTYFEGIINHSPMVYATLRGEKEWLQQDLWREWLRDKGVSGVPLERADGTWQVTLPASVFEGPQAKIATAKVGEYELRNGYFMQIWCDDRAVRRKAVMDRVLRMVKNQQRYIKKQTIQEQLQLLAAQLQVSDVSFDDLRRRARESGMDDTIKVLDNLQY